MNTLNTLSTAFTQRDVEYVHTLFEALDTLRPFNIELYTTEQTDDTLVINGATIQKVVGTVPAIVPREAIRFIVCIPYVVHGGHWEPDDVDFNEVATEDSLHKALCVLYMFECRDKFDNVVQGVQYEHDKALEEQV